MAAKSLTTKARDAGWDARYAAISYTDNPYDKQVRPNEYEHWRRGWRAAHEAIRETGEGPEVDGDIPAVRGVFARR